MTVAESVQLQGAVGLGGTAERIDVQPLVGNQSLREQVAVALRAIVVSGEMRPGEVYSVPSLAARFGVSATPVREAMLDLAQQGLVEPVRNKGFRVTEVTDEQLDQITELRALIEVPTVARLAPLITAEQLDSLRPLAESICASAATGDLTGYLEADRQFHVSLLQFAGNPRLTEVVSELRAQTRLYGLIRLSKDGRLSSSAEEHLELLDALATHDAKLVERIMRRHIGHVRGLWGPRGRD